MGLLIKLPKQPTSILPRSYKDQVLIKFKNHLYFEERDESERVELKPLPGSQVSLCYHGNY